MNSLIIFLINPQKQFFPPTLPSHEKRALFFVKHHLIAILRIFENKKQSKNK